MKYIIVTLILITFFSFAKAQKEDKITLKNNWAIQSSAAISANGKSISQASFQPEKWYPVTMPSTVLAALIDNKVYPDPYYGTNIESLPGFYKGVKGEMPVTSPFRVPWWYRTVFKIPADHKGKHSRLKFQGINYRANIWLNGHLIADTTTIEGVYRLYNLDITKYAVPGVDNCLALEIFPPKGHDLTITWVDWNPTPPDRTMGIWYDVSLSSTGPAAIENPRVITDLDLPSLEVAKLTVSADIQNAEAKPIKGILRGKIENIQFSQEVTLEPNQTKVVTFTPDKFKELVISKPRLWWPHTVGTPNLYDLSLTFETGGKVSDIRNTRFGIRKITSWMNTFDHKRTRVFQVNGKNIVIRGGGYVQDMMLRPSHERANADILYAKHMNLNALRMEAPRGDDYLFDKCDEEGILLMVGWCCCSIWEEWKKWTPHTANRAEQSWHDQIVHLRNHPSVFNWLYGSDLFPPSQIEKRYIKVLDECDGTRPYQSSATNAASAIAGYTGLFMGPYVKGYAYLPPSYWWGRMEFNTEAGPSGEQIPPIESLRKMMPQKDLWPIGPSWNIRLHKVFYPAAREALDSRYGKPAGVEEYCVKSQVLQLEATKAMFEAYAGNKYRSSGIIYWMYNSAWPSLYWQLYDYYFTPNGAFYGAKTACEPLHIQYSYADSSIWVVNSQYREIRGLKASARLYNFNIEEKLAKEVSLTIASDESKKVIVLDKPKDLSPLYFLKLELKDASGKTISSNFYWLSTKGDVNADFTDLDKLAKVDLKYIVSSMTKTDGKCSLTLEIENPSTTLAFFINPKILKSRSSDMVLPVYWDDNYFSLLPNEKRSVKVEFDANALSGEEPVLKIDGWNINPVTKNIK